MVAFEVHVQQLLLSEGLFTLAAGIWFLSCVGSTMHHHVALLTAAIVAHVTFEPLLILMGLLMLDESVAFVENSITVTTLFSSFNKRVLLTKMDTQVTLAGNDSVTVWTVEFGHILCVFL